ncbi:class III poly(R)-hydroxyalkanoic acid synthase subunit PhaC [Salinigranum salinum]|uniref:class III poly(R)-hydroxyalkanoic acid synthase subunit PhaC n=1 Tax=Salinigranum salinum TaxID=1364937 RepID=UPI0012613A15|nr:class III poly(R)-hydroxyalkanoic acid synthase subunit PhaC [Salinigranum salinum]
MTPNDNSRVPPSLRLFLSTQRAASETLADTAHATSVLGDRLTDAASIEVGQTPSEVVYTENKLELHRYESLTDSQHDVPILVVYALINRPFILDLQRDRSVVRRLLEAGHDVSLIDWGEPSLLDSALGLEDYVNRYIDNCVDVVRERAGVEAINLLGYCMGGTMSAIYAALHPEKVNALGLMATGLYFDDTGGVLELWGGEDHYDPWTLVETYGNVPGEFLDIGFDLMDPVANTVTKYIRLADRVENEDFVENFARMETWLNDSVDVAGAVYAEFVEEIYQRNRLAENELVVGGEHVDIENIDVPLLQILGTYDHLVPPAASKPFNDLVGSDDVTTIEYPTGHVGLAMSTSSHRDVWPEVAEWFLDQSDQPGLADVFGEGIERALNIDVETDVTVGDVDEIQISIADEDGEIARELVRHDVVAIEHFFEDALDVELGLDIGAEDIAVTVATADDVVTTVVENVGEAIRTEIEEAVDEVDIAASYDLEDVEGIGPTYADRLRSAGIESVSALAVSEETNVAEVARASTGLARTWIARARKLVSADDAVESER